MPNIGVIRILIVTGTFLISETELQIVSWAAVQEFYLAAWLFAAK